MPLAAWWIEVLPRCAGQDFASGLRRPLNGSSSNPIAPTTLRFPALRINGVERRRVEIYKFLFAQAPVRGNIQKSSVAARSGAALAHKQFRQER